MTRIASTSDMAIRLASIIRSTSGKSRWMFLRVGDQDHDRLMMAEQVVAMKFRRFSITFEAPKDRSSGDFQIAAFLD